jgi:prevent-host-death family protein
MSTRSVGSYEAKTHLPELLERVSRGERILITKNGKPAAMLVPPQSEVRPNVRDVIRAMKDLRRGQTLGRGLTVRDLIDEGRRY